MQPEQPRRTRRVKAGGIKSCLDQDIQDGWMIRIGERKENKDWAVMIIKRYFNSRLWPAPKKIPAIRGRKTI